MEETKALRQIYNLLAIPDENWSDNALKFDGLVKAIDHLIQTDFNRLLAILYRIDVSEEKLKATLVNQRPNQSAGEIIARLMIERELQKIETRKKYK